MIQLHKEHIYQRIALGVKLIRASLTITQTQNLSQILNLHRISTQYQKHHHQNLILHQNLKIVEKNCKPYQQELSYQINLMILRISQVHSQKIYIQLNFTIHNHHLFLNKQT